MPVFPLQASAYQLVGALTLLGISSGFADSLTGTPFEAKTEQVITSILQAKQYYKMSAHLDELWEAGGDAYIRDAFLRFADRVLGPPAPDRHQKLFNALRARTNFRREEPESLLQEALDEAVDDPRYGFTALDVAVEVGYQGWVGAKWMQWRPFTQNFLEFVEGSPFLNDLPEFRTVVWRPGFERGTLLGQFIQALQEYLTAEKWIPYVRLLESKKTFGARAFLAAARDDKAALRQLLKENREAIAALPAGRQLELAVFFHDLLPLEPLQPELEAALAAKARAHWQRMEAASTFKELDYFAVSRASALASEDAKLGIQAYRRLLLLWDEDTGAASKELYVLQEMLGHMRRGYAARFLAMILTQPEDCAALTEWDFPGIFFHIEPEVNEDLEIFPEKVESQSQKLIGLISQLEPELEKLGPCMTGCMVLQWLGPLDAAQKEELTRLLKAKPNTELWDEVRRLIPISTILASETEVAPEVKKTAQEAFRAQLEDVRIPEPYRMAKAEAIDAYFTFFEKRKARSPR